MRSVSRVSGFGFRVLDHRFRDDAFAICKHASWQSRASPPSLRVSVGVAVFIRARGRMCVWARGGKRVCAHVSVGLCTDVTACALM